MKKALLFFLFFLLLIIVPSVKATDGTEPRLASCDLCGYCLQPTPTLPLKPGNWKSCRDCIYPSITTEAENNETLMVDPATNLQVTPYPGHQFTMLGCVKTDLGSFAQEGAAQSLTSIILNFLFSITGGVAFLSLLYGAFILLTSQASPEKIDSGKRIIYGAIVGLIFTILAVFILKILASGVLKIPGFE